MQLQPLVCWFGCDWIFQDKSDMMEETSFQNIGCSGCWFHFRTAVARLFHAWLDCFTPLKLDMVELFAFRFSLVKGKYQACEIDTFVKFHSSHEIFVGVIFFQTICNFIRWKTAQLMLRAMGKIFSDSIFDDQLLPWLFSKNIQTYAFTEFFPILTFVLWKSKTHHD